MCGPDRKMCIYIENGLFLQFFWDNVHSRWNMYVILNTMKKYSALL